MQPCCVNDYVAFRALINAWEPTWYGGQFESTSHEESDEAHLLKRQVIADARAPTGSKREVDQFGYDGSLHEAFGKKVMRLRKVACVVVEQLRAYPNGDIAGELEPTEFESALDLAIEDGRWWMQTHALFQRGEAVGPRQSG